MLLPRVGRERLYLRVSALKVLAGDFSRCSMTNGDLLHLVTSALEASDQAGCQTSQQRQARTQGTPHGRGSTTMPCQVMDMPFFATWRRKRRFRKILKKIEMTLIGNVTFE